MCIYIYTHTYIYIYTCIMFVCLLLIVFLFVILYIYIYIYICVYIYIYIYNVLLNCCPGRGRRGARGTVTLALPSGPPRPRLRVRGPGEVWGPQAEDFFGSSSVSSQNFNSYNLQMRVSNPIFKYIELCVEP